MKKIVLLISIILNIFLITVLFVLEFPKLIHNVNNNINISKEDFMNSCIECSYEKYIRNPDNYIEKNITFTGWVTDIIYESGDFVKFEISTYNKADNVPYEKLSNLEQLKVRNGFKLYEDYYSCTYERQKNEERVLVGDYITIYGIGDTIDTIPKVNVKYIKIIEE